MKRGLKVSRVSVRLRSSIPVTIYSPMKRGLKGWTSYSGVEFNDKLQSIPR